MLVENLKKLAFWSKFVGVFYVISGVISALVGVFAFIVGAIPGLILAFIGWKLCKASKDARELAYSITECELDRHLLSEMVEKYGDAVKVLGIYIIVGIILAIIFIIIAIIVGVASINSLSHISMINF